MDEVTFQKRPRFDEFIHSKIVNEFGQPIGMALPEFKPPSREALIVQGGIQGLYCTLEVLDVKKHAFDLLESYLLDDGRMWTYLSIGPFQELDPFIIALENLKKDKVTYAVLDKVTNKAVGMLSFMKIEVANGSVEIGFVTFSPLLQRTRASTEAFYLMINHCFSVGYRRCEWKCDSLNEPSRRAALRLGFTFEGTFRQSVVYKGRNRDTMWFSILDNEWPKLSAKFGNWLTPDNFDESNQQRRSLGEC